MCGIAGVISFGNPISASDEAVMRMIEQMKSRGPDDRGYLAAWRAPGGSRRPVHFLEPAALHCANQYGVEVPHVMLGHCRLSIIDLSASGHQPMADSSGRYWITYNGEVYNFAEVRQELAGIGVRFRSNSDTEVVVAALREWGTDALQRFNGMFAFALWDDDRKELLLARDRLGIKPLYYHLDRERLVFASDIKGLIASGLYTPAVDTEGFYHSLSFGVAPRPMTAFAGVKAIQPGHWMKIDLSGRAREVRYWRVPTNVQDEGMSEAQATETVSTLLASAVRETLIADVPVGVFLSGGLDSNIIAAFAAREHPGIRAFTLAYEGTTAGLADDAQRAVVAAKQYGIPHILRTISPDDALLHLWEMVGCFEEPYPSLSTNYMIARLAAEEKCTVVLNGLGGDELFGGYRHSRLARLWPILRRLPMAKLIPGRSRGASILRGKLIALQEANTPDRVHTALFSKQLEADKRALFGSAYDAEFDTPTTIAKLYVDDDMEFKDLMEVMIYLDLVNHLANHHLYRLDQFTMHFSVEGRFPFLDHHFVEAAMRIPTRHKIGRRGKSVLRRVADGLIPSSIDAAQKTGFSVPLTRWVDGQLRPFIEEKTSQLAERGIFDGGEVRRRVRDYYDGRNWRSTDVWQLVGVELWFETFFDQAVDRSRQREDIGVLV